MRDHAPHTHPTPLLFALALVIATLLALGAHSTSAATQSPNGRYIGHYEDVDDPDDQGSVVLKVRSNGNRIYAFKASPLAVCVNPDALGGIEVVSRDFLIGEVSVGSDGRFSKRRAIRLGADSRQVFKISGRLLNGNIRNGRMAMKEHCSSVERFTAHAAP